MVVSTVQITQLLLNFGFFFQVFSVVKKQWTILCLIVLMWCLSFPSSCCDKTLWQTWWWGGEGVHFSSQFQLHSIIVGKSRRQELEAASQPTVKRWESVKARHYCSATSTFIQFRILCLGAGTTRSGGVSPPIKIIPRHAHRPTQPGPSGIEIPSPADSRLYPVGS